MTEGTFSGCAAGSQCSGSGCPNCCAPAPLLAMKAFEMEYIPAPAPVFWVPGFYMLPSTGDRLRGLWSRNVQRARSLVVGIGGTR